VCDKSDKFLWDHRDKVGSGATSDVYKAYNIATGEIVAAKVSKLVPRPRYIPTMNRTDGEQTNDPPSVFDRERNVLKNADHRNIIRFIDIERVSKSDNPYALPGPEVLIIEYCNGGSVGDMLQLPANRYGLSEEIIMVVMKDVILALKYLHSKQIVSFIYSQLILNVFYLDPS
jgi:serine/threonine protein kinase